eukprot:Phypoly_transcript_29902.p1 GENE.Phypoly_transcript_29902~~Phypoly_transcript_29902.p1  ORF type:complete len:103 (-),score=16.84 Phypoly_transcript_29902:22-330(-)
MCTHPHMPLFTLTFQFLRSTPLCAPLSCATLSSHLRHSLPPLAPLSRALSLLRAKLAFFHTTLSCATVVPLSRALLSHAMPELHSVVRHPLNPSAAPHNLLR